MAKNTRSSHRSRGAWIEMAALDRLLQLKVMCRIAHAVRGLKSNTYLLQINQKHCRIAHAVRGLKFSICARY